MSEEVKLGSEGEYKIPSIPNILSYGSAGFWSMFTWTVFGQYIFFFYEAVLGLPTIYALSAMLIFTLWDAIDDPLIGYLTDRKTKFTRKAGKRFPWIVIGIIPATLLFGLLFMPPSTDPVAIAADPLPVFGWMIIMTCLFDSLTTLAFVNIDGLFPDKFRNDSARRKARGWGTPLSMLALPFSTIIPPILIGVNLLNPSSYAFMAWICVMIIGTIAIVLLPGMYENKELKDLYYVTEREKVSFISELKSTGKQKSFVYYIILFFGFQVVTGSLTASIPYAVNYVLRGGTFEIILLFASFLQGAIVGVPVWIVIAKKVKNNKKMALIGGILLVISGFMTFFYVGIWDSMVYQLILGFCMANFWALFTIYFSDVLDERVVLTRSPIRGTTVGIQNFFSRLSRGVYLGIIALVHILTKFQDDPTTLSVQIGIRLHMSVIPAIILAICTYIYWKKYPLTPEKSFEIKKQLKELGF